MVLDYYVMLMGVFIIMVKNIYIYIYIYIYREREREREILKKKKVVVNYDFLNF